MTGDDGSSAWSLADSTYDLGMGSYAYQSGSSLETRVEDLAIDSGCPSSSGDGAELANTARSGSAPASRSASIRAVGSRR